MAERVRLASVGLGRWARVLARAVQRSDSIDLVSCFSRSEDKRAAFQEEFGVPRSATTYEELLADDEVEGVVITTPNDTHREVITQALDAGKAAYTDKPIASTLSDAVAIQADVAASGLAFAVGHSARRLSGHRQIKRWIDDGSLGGVSLIEANFSNERALDLTADDWRWYRKGSPGGPLIQLGVHHADTLQSLLGPVRAVNSKVKKLYTKAEIPDATITVLDFEAGPLGYLGCGWASPGVYTMNVLGTKANLFYDLDFTHWDESQQADKFSTLRSQAHGESERRPVDLPPTDMFLEQLEEFGRAIRGDDTIEVGADEAVRALAVVYSALESAERHNGASVEIAEIIDAARGSGRVKEEV